MHKALPKYTLSSLWLVIILVLCWLPKSTVVGPQWFYIPNGDKIVHFILFFIWVLFLQVDFTKKTNRLYYILYLLVAGLFVTVLTEYLQPIVSNRTCDVVDGIVDMAGITAGLVLFKKKK